MNTSERREKIVNRVGSSKLDPSFIPPKIHSILNKLEDAGHSAFIVGGCVRDWFLGYDREEFLAKGGDYDITTSATVDEMKELFRKYKQILDGAEFGTIKLFRDGDIIEITTFRIERAYRDGRHPEEIIFSDRIEDDLSRRDFTINAMAANLQGEVIDPFEGRSDLVSNLVRTVGLPHDRFGEDYLRMLRAVRFTITLNFEIETKTKDAIVDIQSQDIDFSAAVSSERVLNELEKILSHNASRGVNLLIETNLFKEVFPFSDPNSLPTKDLVDLLASSETDWILSLVIILHYLNENSEDKITQDSYHQYLTSMAVPAKDKDHILNLLSQFPLEPEMQQASCSEINRLHHIWKASSTYRQPESHKDRFWQDVFQLHNLFPDHGKIEEKEQQKIIQLWTTYPNPDKVNIHLDGNDLLGLGLRGKIIGDMMKELRILRPRDKKEALQFVNEFSNFPLDKEFISDQIQSNVGETITEIVFTRRKRMNGLK